MNLRAILVTICTSLKSPTERMHSRDQRMYLFNETIFASQKSSTSLGLIWDSNMTDFSLFRDGFCDVISSIAHEQHVFVYFVFFFLFQEVVWSRPSPPQKPPSEGNI